MALPATIQRFNLELADVDRGVYESVELRTAQHPSESEVYLATRVIAYLLHYQDEASMSKSGLSDPDEPPLSVRNLTGEMTHWIDLGLPSAERLHKATKRAERVIVYCHKAASVYLDQLARAQIYRAQEIEFYTLPPEFVNEVANRITRNNTWSVVRTEGELYITVGSETSQGVLSRHVIGEGSVGG